MRVRSYDAPTRVSSQSRFVAFFAFIHSIFDALFCHIVLVYYHIYSENERNFYISTCPNPNPMGSLDNAIPLNYHSSPFQPWDNTGSWGFDTTSDT